MDSLVQSRFDTMGVNFSSGGAILDDPREVERPLVIETPIASALSAIQTAQVAVAPQIVTNAEISEFVGSSTLFAYVGEKGVATNRIATVAAKGETGDKVWELVRLFNEGPMSVKHPLFRDADFAELVVLAHISGGISELQLGTAFYWKSALEHYGHDLVHEMPFFDQNGEITTEFQEAMKGSNRFIDGTVFASDEQIDTWFTDMRSRPASEKMLIHFPGSFASTRVLEEFNKSRSPEKTTQSLIARFEEGYLPNSPTILDAIYVLFQSNLFNQMEYEGGTHRMCMSIDGACALFAIVGGNVEPVLRFGTSDSLRENGLTATRDVSIRSPYADLPPQADYHWAPFDQFTAHDLIFHLPIVSFIPKEHQRLFIELSDALREKGEIDLADRCEDMECNEYRSKEGVDAFMDSLVMHVINTFERKFLKDLHEKYQSLDGPREEKATQFLEIFTELLPQDHKTAAYEKYGQVLWTTLKEVLQQKQEKTAFEEDLCTAIIEVGI